AQPWGQSRAHDNGACARSGLRPSHALATSVTKPTVFGGLHAASDGFRLRRSLHAAWLLQARSSWPGLSRPSLRFGTHPKTWMPGTRPGMTSPEIAAFKHASILRRPGERRDP